MTRLAWRLRKTNRSPPIGSCPKPHGAPPLAERVETLAAVDRRGRHVDPYLHTTRARADHLSRSGLRDSSSAPPSLTPPAAGPASRPAESVPGPRKASDGSLRPQPPADWSCTTRTAANPLRRRRDRWLASHHGDRRAARSSAQAPPPPVEATGRCRLVTITVISHPQARGRLGFDQRRLPLLEPERLTRRDVTGPPPVDSLAPSAQLPEPLTARLCRRHRRSAYGKFPVTRVF